MIQSNGYPLQVLVVDDDQGLRDNLADILSEEGYQPLLAADLAAAQRTAREKRPSLALVDLKLPDGMGLELLSTLKEANPDCACIIMTAFAELATALEAMEQGAYHYLQKPVQLPDLLGLMARAGENLQLKRQMERAQEALRRSEERFRLLSENAPDVIVTLATDGSIDYVNPAWLAILGHEPREVRGRHFVDFARPQDRERYIRAFIKVRDDQHVLRDFSGILVTKDGQELEFAINGAPNFDRQGRVDSLVAVLTDLTPHRRLEEQLRHAQKMEAVGTLAGGIAHDFNNLLQAISGSVQMLRLEKDARDPDLAALEQIDNSVQRAAALVRRLFVFSQKVDQQMKVVDLNSVVAQTADLLRSTIPPMIQIEMELAEGLPPVAADSVQLEQVLVNLGVNARDAMPDGGRLIITTRQVTLGQEQVASDPDLEPGEYLELVVRDTGQGIEPEKLPHIFEPFFTTKEVGKGTGLGLAMVYGIMRAHRGSVSCHSSPGHGAAFRLLLPVSERPLEPAGVTAAAKIPTGHEKILVVDDEGPLLKLTCDMLSRLGYRTITAGSGEEALVTYDLHHPDLVLLDLGMPGMGGRECLKQLMLKDPAVKVLVASGYTDGDHEDQVLAGGAAGFIPKPFRLAQLAERIREVLDG